MSLMKFLLGDKKPTASVARERLQIILAHERGALRGNRPDFMPQLQRELVEVIAKYLPIRHEDIQVALDRDGDLEVLQVKIELPEPSAAR